MFYVEFTGIKTNQIKATLIWKWLLDLEPKPTHH